MSSGQCPDGEGQCQPATAGHGKPCPYDGEPLDKLGAGLLKQMNLAGCPKPGAVATVFVATMP
jgi:hypothetical protein